MVQLNLLLTLLTPITHSKPTRAMIPIGVSTETGAPAGDCCISDHDKAGRSAVQSICFHVVDAVWFEIDHDIASAGRKRGVPDEHRGYSAIHDGCGLDCACDVWRDRAAIVPVLILGNVDVRARAGGEARACGVYVFVHTVSVLWCAVLGCVDLIDHQNHNLFETFMMNTIPINL